MPGKSWREGAFNSAPKQLRDDLDSGDSVWLLVAALPDNRRFSSRLYTKIPLGPVGWDDYYFQLVVKYSQGQTSAASIMNRIDGVRTGFEKAMRKGLTTMEIDPRYCEIIARRWEAYTGLKRKLVNNGENHVLETDNRKDN